MQQRLDASAASVQRLQREALETGGPELSLQIVNLRDHATRHLRRPILYLLMGVVLLLALTLFNLMGLQLASVISRADELEIRAALGASAAALYLPAAIDALLLASASGLGAVGLVALGPELLRNLTSQTSAPWAPFDEYGLRYPAAVIAALVLTGGGSIPAMLAAVRVAGRTTRQSGRAALAGRLVVTSGQVCAATVLCAATFAFSASVTRLARVDLGFRAADVWAGVAGFTGDALSELLSDGAEARVSAVAESLVDSVAELTGVRAAVTTSLPFQANDVSLTVSAPRGTKPGTSYPVLTASVKGDYFRVMSIRLLAGRSFDRADWTSRVVILDRLLAEELFVALLRGSNTDPQRPLPTDPLTTDSVRRRPTKLSHLIEDVTCEDGLRLLPRPTARSKALPDDQLVPEEGVLHTGLLMVARVLLPLSPSSLLHLSDRAVARGRSWSPSRHGGCPGRWNDDRRATRTRSLVDATRVVGRVRREAGDVAFDLVDQIEGRRRVVNMPAGQGVSDDHARSVDAQMKLLPAAYTASAMFHGRPFTFTHSREPGTVDDEMYACARGEAAKCKVEVLTTP